MKSFIASAVLSAAALVNAASIPHGHVHTHIKRNEVEKRAPVKFMSAADVSRLANVVDSTWNAASSILVGKNVAAADQPNAPVAVGGDGPFLVEFCNDSEDDIVVVVWTDIGKANPWDTANVKTEAPDVTHTLKANTTTTVSFNPDAVAAKRISGGWAAVYPGTTMNNGFIFNTWGETTFQTTDAFSTTDVSRLPNMNGNGMEIHNYNKKGDDEPICSSTMSKCSFVCPNKDDKMCTYGGYIQNCPVGTPGTTSSADLAHGGCGGLRKDGGYVKVNFQ
ncbi:Hypothetical protein D9617_14g077740 [Elsinoe fawcettii]|nr:Hypothetical protein D9617_14g077740 [Elsinoe fawcettii]